MCTPNIADTADVPLLFMEGSANKENVPDNANEFQQYETQSVSEESSRQAGT